MMKLRKKFCALVVCVVAILIVRGIWLTWLEESCSVDQSIENVKLLCEEYKAGHLTGSLCPYICDSREIVLHKCLNYVGGKEIYLTSWQGRNLIMKSKKPSWHDYQRFLPYGVDANQANLTILLHFLSETLKDAFNVKPEPSIDLLSQFWFSQKTEIPADSSQRLAVIESIWSLFQQDEYVSIMYLKKSKFMPLLYGTCGHYYFMEYLPSGKVLSPKLWQFSIFKSESYSWKSNVVLALYFLELIKSLDSGFHEEIHMCDLKGDNFGLTKDGVVKVIDVDMLLSNSKLIKIFESFQCSSNEDCHFFDCKAKCDIEKHSCEKSRSNTNLQVLCEQLFRSHLQNSFQGLLDNSPKTIRSDLSQLLDRCINTPMKDPNQLENLYRFLNAHLYVHMMPKHSEP